jgi:hypothetical protein
VTPRQLPLFLLAGAALLLGSLWWLAERGTRRGEPGPAATPVPAGAGPAAGRRADGDDAGQAGEAVRARIAPEPAQAEPPSGAAPARVGDPGRGVVLAGHVRNGSGRGVADAALRALDPINRSALALHAESGELVAWTNAQGAFRIEGLAPGPWRLLISSADHPALVAEGRTSASGEVVADLEFVLCDGAEIGGAVSGARAPGEDIRVRALVLAGEESQGPSLALPGSARCADDGSFLVRGLLPERSYRLAAFRGADDALQRPASGWVEARAGTHGVVLVLALETALEFQVASAADGAPLTELEVRAGCGFLAPLTGPQGRVRRDFPQGHVRVPIRQECGQKPVALELSAPGHADLVLDELYLAPGETRELGLLRLEPVPELEVLVLSEASGEPVPGAQVALAENAAPARLGSEAAPWIQARTDGEGRARLNGTSAPGAILRVRHPEFAPFASEPLAAAPGRTLELTLRLRAGGRVEVLVLDERGSPAVSAWVRPVRRSSPGAADEELEAGRTDRGGRHVFAHIPPGRYRFELVAPRSTAAPTLASEELDVLEGGRHELRLDTPPR